MKRIIERIYAWILGLALLAAPSLGEAQEGNRINRHKEPKYEHSGTLGREGKADGAVIRKFKGNKIEEDGQDVLGRKGDDIRFKPFPGTLPNNVFESNEVTNRKNPLGKDSKFSNEGKRTEKDGRSNQWRYVTPGG
jgi:hypothetical protein